MTFLFAAGVATVILPIAMGAAVFRRLFITQHTTIYVVGAVFLLALAAYTLLGGQIHLPMPGRRGSGKGGPWALWRADYGGAPDHTMYVPVSSLLADLGKGLGKPAA